MGKAGKEHLKDVDRKGIVAIVTPFYKTDLCPEEKISLNHLNHHLTAYDKYVIAPRNLKVNNYGASVIYFDEGYFQSTLTYNRLLLSKEFYKEFQHYKYILIYQLDCLVFSDNLLKFCELDLDYIGAPWVIMNEKLEPKFDGVGNGGLSLRKISSFLKVFDSKRLVIDPQKQGRKIILSRSFPRNIYRRIYFWYELLNNFYNVQQYIHKYHYNEDFFWGTIAHLYDPKFRVADLKTGLQFAFELEPRFCFEENKKNIPFGCHAWYRYDRAFWEPFLLK